MGLLNLDKKVKLTLEKEKFTLGEKVKGNIEFNFGLKPVKIDKILIIFRKTIKKDKKVYSNGGYNYRTVTENITILNKVLKDMGEYKNEYLNFDFVIPQNCYKKTNKAEEKLKEILEKIKIKGIFARIIELIFTVAFSSNIGNETYEVEARLDIPWGIDVKQVKKISLFESKEQLDNENKILEELVNEK